MGLERLTGTVPTVDIPIAILRGYQRLVSPYLGDCCRFHPSCSEYMIGSLRLNGLLVGAFDGMWRVLRCNPLSRGGVDAPRRIRRSRP